MKTQKIKVAEDFSRYPAGRKCTDGPFSGEEFRERMLLPAWEQADIVEISLDGVIGYGSSFLEEAFGGSIRKLRISPESFLRRIRLDSKDPSLIIEIEGYIKAAGQDGADTGPRHGL